MSARGDRTALAGSASRRPPSAAQHQHHASAPAIYRVGGALEFSDLKGRAIGDADFRGRWTLLFFGYSRCRASCPIAIPKIARVAADLRQADVPARAIFVDIDVPPLGVMRFRRPGAVAQFGGHAVPICSHSDVDRVAAMRALASHFAGRLVVATGTRGQLAAASRAFSVAREHIPPRKGEEGHSINHSSLIYVIAPDCRVAGYASHDIDPGDLSKRISSLVRRSKVSV